MKTLLGARWETALSPLKPVAIISDTNEGKEDVTALFFVASRMEARKVILQTLQHELNLEPSFDGI